MRASLRLGQRGIPLQADDACRGVFAAGIRPDQPDFDGFARRSVRHDRNGPLATRRSRREGSLPVAGVACRLLRTARRPP